MLECIEAAVRKVIEMGYVDPNAVGLSGHSYSGGGGAYVATRSTMFAAVAHGAAPINLVSEFNQLFVGSGQNNHRYDIYGQGRYGTNPYDDFQLYWDQSPISGVETMDTPVLYLHGEADPTVNWEQGLEWYNALRFLGKPIIWLSYPDEGHGLSKLENRIDFQFRLRQFFDHHLKGAPAPKWMTDGVSQMDKAKHLREFDPKVFEKPDTTGGRWEGREMTPPSPRPGPSHSRHGRCLLWATGCGSEVPTPEAMASAFLEAPDPPQVEWVGLIGEYATGTDTLSVLEDTQNLYVLFWKGGGQALRPASDSTFEMAGNGGTITVARGPDGWCRPWGSGNGLPPS